MKNPNKHKGKKGRFIENNTLINDLKKTIYLKNCEIKRLKIVKAEKEKYIVDIHNFIGKKLLKEFKQKINPSQGESQDNNKINNGGQNGN